MTKQQQEDLKCMIFEAVADFIVKHKVTRAEMSKALCELSHDIRDGVGNIFEDGNAKNKEDNP